VLGDEDFEDAVEDIRRTHERVRAREGEHLRPVFVNATLCWMTPA